MAGALGGLHGDDLRDLRGVGRRRRRAPRPGAHPPDAGHPHPEGLRSVVRRPDRPTRRRVALAGPFQLLWSGFGAPESARTTNDRSRQRPVTLTTTENTEQGKRPIGGAPPARRPRRRQPEDQRLHGRAHHHPAVRRLRRGEHPPHGHRHPWRRRRPAAGEPPRPSCPRQRGCRERQHLVDEDQRQHEPSQGDHAPRGLPRRPMVLFPEVRRPSRRLRRPDPVWTDGYDIAAARTQARAGRSQEPREDVAEVVDLDADGVPGPALPAGRRRPGSSCTCTAAASSSTTSTSTTGRAAGSPTGPARRCSASTTGAARAPVPGGPRRRRHGGRLARPGGAGLGRPGRRTSTATAPAATSRWWPRCATPAGSGRSCWSTRSSTRAPASTSYRTAPPRLRPARGRLVLAAVRRGARRPRPTPTSRRCCSDRLGTLPPTLVVTAEHDPLRDEGEHLAGAARRGGRRRSVHAYLGLIHGFWRQPRSSRRPSR